MDVLLSDPLSTLSRCPRCGIARPNLNLRHVAYKLNELGGTQTPYQAWAIYQCSSCFDVVCFKTLLLFASDLNSQRATLNQLRPPALECMPAEAEALDDWPQRAKTYMSQALESLTAPDGAVMLAGSAVDAMLKDKGYIEGSVYARINEAVDSGLLTAEMGEWAHSVRLAANNPRHADLNSPHATAAEARSTLDFTRALGTFLYTLPERVRRGREAAMPSK